MRSIEIKHQLRGNVQPPYGCDKVTGKNAVWMSDNKSRGINK